NAENADRTQQTDIFQRQLFLAHELKLPVVIHCRGAFQELIGCIKESGIPHGGMVHAFNGSAELAQELVRHGLHISLGGVLTYRDSRKRKQMLRSIPENRLLLETDSPDIPPAEKKGMRNEPAFIRYVLTAASELLDLPEEKIAQQCRDNAAELFSVS
ncbi:MAG: TatD family hydrolase, partial [Spirochaetota bacterium]